MAETDEAAAALQAVSEAMTVDTLPALGQASQAARDALGGLASAGADYVSGEMGAITTQIDVHIGNARRMAGQLDEMARAEAARLQAGG